jgi:hypothetical protein
MRQGAAAEGMGLLLHQQLLAVKQQHLDSPTAESCGYSQQLTDGQLLLPLL